MKFRYQFFHNLTAGGLEDTLAEYEEYNWRVHSLFCHTSDGEQYYDILLEVQVN